MSARSGLRAPLSARSGLRLRLSARFGPYGPSLISISADQPFVCPFTWTASPEQPKMARCVSDFGAGGHRLLQRCVVGVGVGAECTADAEEPGAEFLVALQVFGLEAWALGGEAVGPTQDGELLPEWSGGAGESFGRVVRAGMAHKAYLQVQRGQGRHQVRLRG